MKKILLAGAFSVLAFSSCEGGLTYSSCVVTTTDPFWNALTPNGVCVDIDGGGFLLSSDAQTYCKDEIMNGSDSFFGLTMDELDAEPQRASCPTEEE